MTLNTIYSLIIAFVFVSLPTQLLAEGETKPANHSTRLRIATVDMQFLFKEYYRTQLEQQKFSEAFARIQKEDQERLSSIRALTEVMAVQRKKIDDPTLADSIRQQELKSYRLKIREAEAMDKERREFISRRTRALELKKQASMQGLLEEIRQVIIEFAKTEDFDYVFDKTGLSSNQVPLLLYTKDVTDITSAILKKLNAKAGETSKTHKS